MRLRDFRTSALPKPIDLSPLQGMPLEYVQCETAVVDFRPLAGMSLLHLKLETGRTHQIRVHLAAIGHPVLGDPTYGVSGAQIGLGRQFLHAARLGFEHPADGHRVERSSELPPDLAEALERARAAG